MVVPGLPSGMNLRRAICNSTTFVAGSRTRRYEEGLETGALGFAVGAAKVHRASEKSRTETRQIEGNTGLMMSIITQYAGCSKEVTLNCSQGLICD